jgi:UPF0716 protein FxsA
MARKIPITTKLFLTFTIMPLIELYILFQIARAANWIFTFAAVIAAGFAGAYLAKREGRGVLVRIQRDLHEGRMPGEELLNGLAVLVGGALLLAPGFLTDIFAFTLLIPFTRYYFKRYFKHKFKEIINSGNFKFYFR